MAENNQLHNRIIELEQQQIQGEDRLCEMAIQAQDYADLLEQAQTTIDQLSQIEEDDLSSLSSSTTEIKKVIKQKLFYFSPYIFFIGRGLFY